MRTILLRYPIFVDLSRWWRRRIRYGGLGALAVLLVGIVVWDQYRHAPFHVVEDGQHHYWIKVRLNNVMVSCLVDTGSSGLFITKDIADRLGFRNLRYTRRGSTANGTIRTASAKVERVEAAGIVFSYFDVVVSGTKEDSCLLGSSWLERVRYTASGGVLTIWPKGV